MGENGEGQVDDVGEADRRKRERGRDKERKMKGR